MRANLRLPVVLAINLESEHHLVSGVVRNISEGGLFVETHHIMPPRSRVAAQLPIGEESVEVSLDCEVSWCRPFDPLVPEEPPGMGLRFVELGAEASAQLQQFCAGRRVPIFGD